VDLYEYQAKDLFAAHGVPVGPGQRVVADVEAVGAAAAEFGVPVVIKAQVKVGGRGKAGGVKVAADPADATAKAGAILGLDIKRNIGFSTAVGIGGDPIIGTTHIDALAAFEADPQTELIVMIGEIGGDAEERAAAYIQQHVSKPVVGYVAGFTAPEGKTMGHAGAIVSGSSGTAAAKKEALEAAGVKVGKTPSETAELARVSLGQLVS
jgi:succinyl-CoA synthetase alpha subunit